MTAIFIRAFTCKLANVCISTPVNCHTINQQLNDTTHTLFYFKFFYFSFFPSNFNLHQTLKDFPVAQRTVSIMRVYKKIHLNYNEVFFFQTVTFSLQTKYKYKIKKHKQVQIEHNQDLQDPTELKRKNIFYTFLVFKFKIIFIQMKKKAKKIMQRLCRDLVCRGFIFWFVMLQLEREKNGSLLNYIMNWKNEMLKRTQTEDPHST